MYWPGRLDGHVQQEKPRLALSIGQADPTKRLMIHNQAAFERARAGAPDA